MPEVHLFMKTKFSGDIRLGKIACEDDRHARVAVQAYRQQHPFVADQIRFEIEDRDPNGNLLRRMLG